MGRFSILRSILGIVAALTLAACASTSAFDDLDGAQPSGTPFQQALFKNYAFLARSFVPAGTSIGDLDDPIQGLAEAYANKAMIAAGGVNVAPEDGATPDQQAMRERLMHALGEGRDNFPEDAARAQADYDCWVMNATVAATAGASAQCGASLNVTLARFERDIHPPVAAAPPPPPAPPSGYVAYFDFNSWTLTAEDLTVLQQAISDARNGGQSHISVVGHTDTVGSARYNRRLSKKRANVVKDALVDMGARRAAVSATGVGKTDLAVPTGNGVREAKNRRAVVTLQP